MPIQIRCQCGKSLKIPDSMAGKAVKCPGCGTAIRVPVPAAPAAAEPQSGGIGDLFDEEGFSEKVEAVCPACRAEMAADAVLCVKCGYHKQEGTQFAAHKTAGVDIDHGTLALEKAESDMVKDRAIQEKLLKGQGLPWWGLALVLFVVGSGVTLAVLQVNASRRVDGATRDYMGLFLLLSGIGCAMVSLGAYWLILVHGCKKMGKKGLLNLFPPYALFYVGFNFKATWKSLLVLLVLGGLAAALIVEATNRGI